MTVQFNSNDHDSIDEGNHLCEPGRFSNALTDFEQCGECAKGSSESGIASTGCTPCAAGRFSSDSAALTYMECIGGSFSATTTGLSICEQCAQGRVAGVGASGCSRCAASTGFDKSRVQSRVPHSHKSRRHCSSLPFIHRHAHGWWYTPQHRRADCAAGCGDK
jgi:hypothetical protein